MTLYHTRAKKVPNICQIASLRRNSAKIALLTRTLWSKEGPRFLGENGVLGCVVRMDTR
jgi:hypothetical protein